MSQKSIVEWSEPIIVPTVNGERQLRTAKPTPPFWDKWAAEKDQLKLKGVQVVKEKGEFLIKWWSPVKVANQAERIALSGAESSTMEFPCPEGLAYLPYQKAGIEYGLGTPNVLIGDEMGLGKTIQAIGILNCDQTLKRGIVICPATLKLNWRNEMNKWLTRPSSIEIAEGKTWPSHFGAADDGQMEITIINYDILANHSGVLHSREWDFIIADEVHYLKNSKAQRTKVVFGGGRGKKRIEPVSSRRFIALTGTPILNRPVELWTLSHYMAPHEFPNYYQFATRYCGGGKGYGGSMDVSGASNLDELQLKLKRSFMVRRLKKNVLKDLPDKVRQIIEMPPSDSIRRVLDREKQQFNLREDSMRALEARQQLAEVSGDEDSYKRATAELREASSVRFDEMSAIRKQIAVQKIPFVVQSIKSTLECDDGKVIIMAHHHEMVDALVRDLSGYGVVKIDGRMTDKAARQRAVDDFQKDPRIRVFVGSIKAAGVGITLTASSTVIFAELDWVPGNMDQCEDRAHRIGQKDTVLVQYLVLEGSIDSMMAKRLVEKKAVIVQALDTNIADSVREEDGDHDAPEMGYEESRLSPGRKKSPYLSIGQSMSEDQKDIALRCVQIIASYDDDRASTRNGAGFSKLDTAMGNQIAQLSNISVAQAGLCKTLALKYRRQLPQELIEILNDGSN